MEELVPKRRRGDRASTRRDAECKVGGKTWTGTIHDLSAGGAFFQPIQCLTDGEELAPDEAWMAAAHGDAFELRLSDRLPPRQSISGRVSWSGCSDVHHTSGLGLCFEA